MKSKMLFLVIVFLINTTYILNAQIEWTKTSIPADSMKFITYSEKYDSLDYYERGYDKILFALSNDNILYRLTLSFQEPLNEKELKQLNIPKDSIEYTSLYSFNSTVLIGTNNKGILLSTDFGESWENIKDSITELNITSFTFHENNTWIDISKWDNRDFIYCGTNKGLYYSLDSGFHWHKYQNIFGNKNIYNIYSTISPLPEQSELFIATYDSLLFRSTNDGKNWTILKINEKNKLITRFCDNMNVIYLSTDDIIYSISFSGDTLTKLPLDLPSKYITGLYSFYTKFAPETLKINVKPKPYPIVLSPFFGGSNLLISTRYNGIFNRCTFDSRTDSLWHEFNDGIFDKHIISMIGNNPEFQYLTLFAATESEGVYRTIISTISVSFSSSPDSSISIINSSSGLLRVKFNLQAYSGARLGFYDVMGNKTGNDYELNLSSGVQIMDIEISNLPTGLYFIKLQTKDRVSVKKILVTR